MVTMIALRALVYAGRRIDAGDIFHARPHDARVLMAIRQADIFRPVVSKPSKRQYKRRDMAAEPVVSSVVEPVVEPPVVEASPVVPDEDAN